MHSLFAGILHISLITTIPPGLVGPFCIYRALLPSYTIEFVGGGVRKGVGPVMFKGGGAHINLIK